MKFFDEFGNVVKIMYFSVCVGGGGEDGHIGNRIEHLVGRKL